MNDRPRWSDAQEATRRLTITNRRSLLLLARLPLASAGVIAALAGLASDASVYRDLGHLRRAGLIDAIRPSVRPGHSPHLWYTTDLGLATIALDQGVDPRHLAYHYRLRGSDLLGLLPGLPHLQRCYQMLVALARSHEGQPELLAWERPWRRHFWRPTAKLRVSVHLPAYTALAWNDTSADYLLLPDNATVPLSAYRGTIRHLFAFRTSCRVDQPILFIAADGPTRVSAWEWLLEDIRRILSEAPLDACIATWEDLTSDLADLNPDGRARVGPPHRFVQPVRVRPLRPRHPGRTLPRLVGDTLKRSVAHLPPPERLGAVALHPSVVDRQLLDLVGRQAFLPLTSLVSVLGWSKRWTRRRRNRLIELGLMRLVGPEEVDDRTAAQELGELTGEGVRLFAAQLDLSFSAVVRYLGLSGGGLIQPIGSRKNLLGTLAHTLGVQDIFIHLIRSARASVAAGGDDALVEWRNAAACARKYVRPDGYGVYRHRGHLLGFFLEYDRGTESARDYREKFAGYLAFRDRLLFERDYAGFPTILVVTVDLGPEERIARALRAVSVGRPTPLPILLTTTERIKADRRRLLGPIWRTPDEGQCPRRLWPHLETGGMI